MGLIKTVEANCRDCYKCVRACPVKAINVLDAHAQIDEERCVLCSRCVPICPQNARSIYNQIDFVKKLLKGNNQVAISLAPTFPAAAEGDVKDYLSALGTAGFQRIFETSQSLNSILELYRQANKPAISSICPAVVSLVEKYFPELKDLLVPVSSPIIADSRYLRRSLPDEYLVYTVSCDAQKAEILKEPEVDAVLTLKELAEILNEDKDKVLDQNVKESVCEFENKTLFSGRTIGINGALSRSLGYDVPFDARSVVISGFEACIDFLTQMKQKRVGKEVEFVEMWLCQGGCISGAGVPDNLSLNEKKEKILEFAKGSDSNGATTKLLNDNLNREFTEKPVITPTPTQKQLNDILASMGKRSKSDELDCGACGYDTCREKALAVFRGAAEIEMCIPYMKTRAESMNDVIIQATPNGIIVCDTNLNIVTINPAAERMFQCRQEALKGKKVSTLVDDGIFREVLEKKRLSANNIEYPAYGLKVRHFVFYVPKTQVVIAIFADITEQSRQKDQLSELRKETLERAQEVINKQMRVAQEIASLLGETTAETKVTLDQLIRIIKG
ncbi:MAG: [Fe-Fe] hydrogenase large subunit C-terminal domain-containing protein [Firmicutes bacterium]|nr:[Fe-Fe] hydrogenase large subunit C-terminal domain-containing protein [Bacillota bacterium]